MSGIEERWKLMTGGRTSPVRKEALRGRVVPPVCERFLFRLGLPYEAAPFLSFSLPAGGFPFPSETWGVAEDMDRYVPVGQDGSGGAICMRSPDGAVVVLDHEDGMSEVGVNASWGQFCWSLVIYDTMMSRLADADEGEGPQLLERLERMLQKADSTALSSGSFWAQVLKDERAELD